MCIYVCVCVCVCLCVCVCVWDIVLIAVYDTLINLFYKSVILTSLLFYDEVTIVLYLILYYG